MSRNCTGNGTQTEQPFYKRTHVWSGYKCVMVCRYRWTGVKAKVMRTLTHQWRHHNAYSVPVLTTVDYTWSHRPKVVPCLVRKGNWIHEDIAISVNTVSGLTLIYHFQTVHQVSNPEKQVAPLIWRLSRDNENCPKYI